MSKIMNSQDRRDATCGAYGELPRLGGAGQQFWPSRKRAAWLWLVVLVAAVAVAASGCGGGDTSESAAEEEEETEATEPTGMGPPAQAAAKPSAPKPEQKKEEAEGPLPDEVSEWQKDDYYRAKREHDPRLIDAVAHLGKQFAGTAQADSAAQLLTNLLKKSEEPEPKAGARVPGGVPAGYPGMGPPGMAPPGMAPPGMGATMPGMGPPPGMSSSPGAVPGGDYESYMAAEAETDEMSTMPGMDYGPRGGPVPTGMGRPGAEGANTALIRAIVSALGINASGTARQTLKQVVEGTFETDDNRVATLATLETFVLHLCSEYEDLLFRCLTSPEKLRALGKAGQAGQPGRPPYGMPGEEMYDQYRSGSYPGMARGRSGSGPLTAEELQREAFSLIAPVASEEFRVRLAKHLASPTSPREDHQLFGEFIRQMHPNNVAAQMVLYLAPDVDTQTKETIEDNFIAYSSDALAGILGIPADQRQTARRPRRQRPRGPAGYPGMEEYGDERMRAGMDYDSMMEDEGGMPGAMPPGMDPGMYRPGGVGPGAPGGVDASGRPSRYDAGAAARPSRYGQGLPGVQQQPAAGMDVFQRADPDLPFRMARHMWGPDMAKLVQARLSQIGSLEGNEDIVLLASTMPVDATRSALYQMLVLQQHWRDGPRALESAGLLEHVVSDPGFLVLVKMFPREDLQQETQPRPTLSRLRDARSGRGPYGRGPGEGEAAEGMRPGRVPRGGAKPPGAEEYEDRMGAAAPGMPGVPGGAPGSREADQKPEVAWMLTSEDLLRVLCERLLAAARSTGGPSQSGEGLPLEIRDDAVVIAEYHLDWPGSQPQQLAGVPLGEMKLHYVRAEQTTRLSTLESYYKRQLGTPDVHAVENGSWIDSLRPVPESDWKRSIDLLFTATVGPDEELDKKQELPITLDVLCIDIKDPARAAQGN